MGLRSLVEVVCKEKKFCAMDMFEIMHGLTFESVAARLHHLRKA